MDDEAYSFERKLLLKEAVRKKDENTPLPPIPAESISYSIEKSCYHCPQCQQT